MLESPIVEMNNFENKFSKNVTFTVLNELNAIKFFNFVLLFCMSPTHLVLSLQMLGCK